MMKHFLVKITIVCGILFSIYSCQQKSNKNIPVIGFIDAFEDETIAQARIGFVQALADSGYSDKDKTVEIIFRNAQGDIPTLTQIVNYFISKKADLIAANSTLAAITAIQKAKEIPVFMMVSAEPKNMMVLDKDGNAPKNLYGISETLDYIDTSLSLIPKLIQPQNKIIRVGMIYNQAEPQSQNAIDRAEKMASKLGIQIVALPINNSADAQLVTQALLEKGIDVFFANPDNVVFASFETILKNCNQKNIPIFTSEAGLVKRGAVAAYGADMYQWGYQAGQQAAKFLKQKSTDGLKIETVKVRKYIYNKEVAKKYNFQFNSPFEAVE
jgi:putative ABC transport system substrate-binding protein